MEIGGAPQCLGDFDILRELGRGGMGIVYEAWQMSLNRRVALKVLSPSLVSTPKAIGRFRREAEATAKLHHKNIVPVYATGEKDGTYYYAMEYLPGPALDVIIRRLRKNPDLDEAWKVSVQSQPVPESDLDVTPDLYADTEIEPLLVDSSIASEFAAPELPSPPLTQEPKPRKPPSGRDHFSRIATIIAGVADGLEHAHQQGIIHRDVKPSNLLVSSTGELSVNDFGLARLTSEPGVTLSGEILGSPTYMSPEQVAAGRVPIDHRTDIYSLGATLYEFVTLRSLFPGSQRDQVLAQIIQKAPDPPHLINKNVPPDLETICLKALERDPDARYQSCGELAADLRRFATSDAIRARRPGHLARALRWTRRHPTTAALLTLLCCLGAATGFFSQKWYEAEAQGRAAQDIVSQFINQSQSRGREISERRYEIAAACWVRPGMTVADIGAGTGLFTRLFSPLVGSEGHVFAVDYSTLLVDHLEQVAGELPLGNVTVVRCSPDSVNLARESVDLAFICDTYRYFREPQRSMRTVYRTLRPHGAVVVIDSQRREAPDATDPDGAPPLPVKAPSALIDEIEAAGFRLVGEETFLLESYFLRFEKISPNE